MAIIKCKMCGGDLSIVEGESVCECEYCGTRQTIPTADNEKKLTLFARANRLRLASEFDKAFGIYESIVAEFPEEAEAYWGLVLCKYGIEYVDDPATGKKIPTCHRSSFESVLKDSDFEQACENADAIARKLYREEAKQIEGIRKGILEVSGKEDPYDIFICYKETDENGDRTLDSVLAQDIYDALTGKGYRVFFARITLEDKLGQEYEPYIFAALNSAKIMLAVGTDYEYYNAVWVKNEWSRYLKLMAKDKDKHLIPCYKNLDAYDMPEEFAKLQAQDLGKVGATQDLLRGIEKLLPKEKSEFRETVVVQQTDGSRTDALLKRGYMALEDGTWEQASDFFEEVLNQNAECAGAYLGKALAEEKASDLNQLIDIRLKKTKAAEARELPGPVYSTHIAETARQFAVPNFLAESEIKELYQNSKGYRSELSSRKQQLTTEKTYWYSHRSMTRALQFADPSGKEKIQKALGSIYSEMEQRIHSAAEQENTARETAIEDYKKYLKEIDERARRLSLEAQERRQQKYYKYCKVLQDSLNIEQLREAQKGFESIGDYLDCRQNAEKCKERISELEAKEKKLQEAEAEKARQQKKKQSKIIAAVVSAAAAAAIIAVVIVKVMIPGQKYAAAEELLQAGKYEEAITAFSELGDFKDCKDRIQEANLGIENAELQMQYNAAEQLFEDGKYEEAIAAFKKLGKFSDSEDRIHEYYYHQAEALEKDGKTTEAAMMYGRADHWRDAWEKSSALWSRITNRENFSAGYTHSVAIKNDGTVVATPYLKDGEDGCCDVDSWKDIIAVSAGDTYTVGLCNDGTVVATGQNLHGQCDVENWENIVAISAGADHTLGLRSDGTVVATNYKSTTDFGQCDVNGWSNIIKISAGNMLSTGIKADGSISAAGAPKMRNGSIITDVRNWENIEEISAGTNHIAGMSRNHTAALANMNCEKLIQKSQIADIEAGRDRTAVLYENGKVEAFEESLSFADGDSVEEINTRLKDWNDIVAINIGEYHILGQKSDGTILAESFGFLADYGQCHVSGWNDIKLPESVEQ